MYGLLLENLSMFIKLQWGESNWDAVRRHANIDAATFGIHHVYAETIIHRLARSAVQVLGVEEKEFFDAMGVYFVEFVGQFGYDQVMSVLGRHMRDFLNGLDNLHEYLKYSFPKMRPPSFFCENETVDGLTLHYRSKRRGFIYYTMGQIKQVAKHFYDTDCVIELRSEVLDGDTMHVIFQLKFDNRALIRTESMMHIFRDDQLLPFRTSMLFELFPFCIVFSEDMVIRQTGQSLYLLLRDLVGQCVTDSFDMVRPLIAFTFHSILERRNNIFELVTVAPINDDEILAAGSMDEEDTGTVLHLKGQMLYMDDWQSMMFLATPVMPDLESLLAAGLFINDLSLHDCSRDLILAGTQQSVELRLALDQEKTKSLRLEDSMKKLDDEMRRTDELLYQMIPKKIADRIRLGDSPVDTCEVYEVVSILFSDVVTFTEICSRINPMQVVSMLNHMYSLFDQLTERNGVYKVETIGDAYMVVSGAPNQEVNHAERICDMAMDMIDASMGIFDPSRDGEHLKLRVGVHSGNVVAGVVGLKMPRWCLFGDAVNTSSRMESTSEAGRIQISEKTKQLLPGPYQHEYRGEIPMKGKGMMPTYWLTGREGRIPLSQLQCNTFSWAAPEMHVYTAPAGGESVGPPAFGKEKSMSVSESDGPTSRAKSWGSQSQESTTRHDSHLPGLTHQLTTDKMNLDAAKQAVNKSLMMRKKSKAAALEAEDTEKLTKKLEAAASSSAEAPPAASPSSEVPPATPGTNDPKDELPVPKSVTPARRRSSVTPADTLEKPEVTKPPSSPSKKTEVAKPAGDPKLSPKITKQENTASEAPPRKNSKVEAPPRKNSKAEAPALAVANPVPGVKIDGPEAKKLDVEKPVDSAPPKGKDGGSESKSDGNPPASAVSAAASIIQSRKPSRVEPLSNSIPLSDQALNQTQDNSLIVKATLNENSSPIGKIEGSTNDVGNVGAKIGAEDDPKENNEGGGKTERLLKRIRGNKNKVALLTSEAMSQMGCPGFGSRQKEVMSQTCGLL